MPRLVTKVSEPHLQRPWRPRTARRARPRGRRGQRGGLQAGGSRWRVAVPGTHRGERMAQHRGPGSARGARRRQLRRKDVGVGAVIAAGERWEALRPPRRVAWGGSGTEPLMCQSAIPAVDTAKWRPASQPRHTYILLTLSLTRRAHRASVAATGKIRLPRCLARATSLSKARRDDSWRLLAKLCLRAASA